MGFRKLIHNNKAAVLVYHRVQPFFFSGCMKTVQGQVVFDEKSNDSIFGPLVSSPERI